MHLRTLYILLNIWKILVVQAKSLKIDYTSEAIKLSSTGNVTTPVSAALRIPVNEYMRGELTEDYRTLSAKHATNPFTIQLPNGFNPQAAPERNYFEENRSSSANFNETIYANITPETIGLPKGFNPVPPPIKPLLYPFVTETTAVNNKELSVGWKPIVNPVAPMQIPGTTVTPSLQKYKLESGTGVIAADGIHAMDSIIYGAWKPEAPLQPDDVVEYSAENQYTVQRRVDDSFEEAADNPIDELIEPMGISHPIPTNHKQTSNSQTQLPKYHKKLKQHTYSNQGVTIPTAQMKNTLAAIKVINLNSTDPLFVKMANQINHSAEFNIYPTTTKTTLKTQLSQEENQSDYNETTNVKNWPTDFMAEDGNDVVMMETTESINNYMAVSTLAPPILNIHEVEDALLAQIPDNITKIGTPYQNFTLIEDPKICVPVTVQEKAMGAMDELIEVERIYCFPIPENFVETTTWNNSLEPTEQVKTVHKTFMDYTSFAQKLKRNCYLNLITALILVLNLNLN